jgi:hypothetical protein
MDNKKLETLLKFFEISTSAFSLVDAIQSQFGEMPKISKYLQMQELHNLALVEIKKESPDAKIIDGLLRQMDDLARMPIKPAPSFEIGGIVNNKESDIAPLLKL